jgi:tRNA dimethylallyltransferase
VTRHLAIIGATASGKSDLAMALAEERGDVEIVSLDSMQVYRGLDIGTAKPTLAERDRVVHHLVDLADPSDDWSVRETQHGARAALAGIEARGHRAILVGGTGLYVRGVVDDLAVPPTDASLRAELEGRVETDAGLAAAYARLEALDPVAATRIEPGNRRRIVRALEVIELTGRPFSASGPGLERYGPPAIDVTLIGVGFSRETRATRIAARVAVMRAAGFVDEVRALTTRPAPLSRTARQAIGYRELLDHVEGRQPDLDLAFDDIVTRTRRFARRQDVWFRRDPRITWFAPAENGDSMLGPVLARWESPQAPARATA